jgi:hypothetical protein
MRIQRTQASRQAGVAVDHRAATDSGRAARRSRPRHPALLVVAACTSIVLLLAGCGGAGSSPSGVATLGSADPGASGQGATSPPGSGSAYEQALAYSQCMRSHGVPDFPDPVSTAGGGYTRNIEVGAGSDLDPATPQFQAAYRACRSLVPASSPGDRQQVDEQRRTQALAYSSCMRGHGVANFPDPVFDATGEHVTLDGSIDTGSAAFQSADAACQPLLQDTSGGQSSSGDGSSAP